MATRKPGNNKRAPRASGPNGICVSIMPDGNAEVFTPKKKKPRKGIAMVDGAWMRTEIEKALY